MLGWGSEAISQIKVGQGSQEGWEETSIISKTFLSARVKEDLWRWCGGDERM